MMMSSLGWAVAFDYANWLRFSSPRSPNEATGQVVYEKAVKGVFYITQAQALWAQYDLVPIWLVGALAFALLYITRGEERVPSPAPSLAWVFAAAAWLFVASALVFFGDHVMTLVFAGTLNVPRYDH